MRWVIGTAAASSEQAVIRSAARRSYWSQTIETLTVSTVAAIAAAPQVSISRRRMTIIANRIVTENTRLNSTLLVHLTASALAQTASDAVLLPSEKIRADLENARDDCHRSNARMAAVTTSSTPRMPTFLTIPTSSDA